MIGIGGYYIPDSEAAKGQEIEREIDFFQGEHGMVGMKFKVGARSPAEDAARLVRARRHAGDDFLFVVDANQGFTVPEALAFLAAVRAEGIELRWFEEPTRWHADFRGLRDVRLRGNVDVAAGQSEISRVGMREMMADGRDRRLQLRRLVGRRAHRVAARRGPRERVRRPAGSPRGGPGGQPPAGLASRTAPTSRRSRPSAIPIFWQMLANRPALVDGEFPLPRGARPRLGPGRGVHRAVPGRPVAGQTSVTAPKGAVLGLLKPIPGG